jgi:arylsulfatase A-like enzyme
MKNLILISLDTVRADVAYSGKFPGINFLMKKGVTFENCISSSPLTPISHATVFTGLQPKNHGIRHLFKESIKKDIPTLQKILKSKGYKTGAIVSCPGMNSWYGFSEGFDIYDDEIPKLADGTDPLKTIDVKLRGTALKRADIVVARANAWLDKQKEPFFLFIHFFDAHWPYEAPEKFGGENAYEEEVAYSDHYLQKFIKNIADRPFYKNTSIICFSDHGEDLNGLYPNDKGQIYKEEFGHGCLLSEQTQRTVLIINSPNLEKNKHIREQVGLIDITPTILDLLGIEPINNIEGISLVPLIKGENYKNNAAYFETFYPEEKIPRGKEENKIGYRLNNQYKLIIHQNSGKIELYDLSIDPNELNNLFSN